MSYISKFKTDTAYNNIDINEVTSIITGAGVVPSTPNDILSSYAESGVTLEDCRCEVSWASEERTQVKIASGTVIMPDGSYIIIKDEILSVASRAKHYVYIYHDLFLHNIPVCSMTLPQENEQYVLLAEVYKGEITDKRPLAKSKIVGYGSKPIMEKNITIVSTSQVVKAGDPLASVEVGADYSKAIIYCSSHGFFGVFNFETGLFEYIYTKKHNFFGTNTGVIDTPTLLNYLSLRYANGILTFHSSANVYSSIDITFNIHINVF